MDILEKELELKIANAQSDEEVIQIFTDAGMAVTLEQLNVKQEQENDELSEGALDTVSGGSVWYVIKKLWTRYKASRYNGGGGGFSSGGGGGGGGGGGCGR